MQNAIASPDKAPLARLFSAKHEFPTEWYRFLHPDNTAPSQPSQPSTTPGQTLKLHLTPERFPFQFRGKAIQIGKVELFLKLKAKPNKPSPFDLFLTTPNETDNQVTTDNNPTFGELILTGEKEINPAQGCGEWSIKVITTDLAKIGDAIADIIIVCHYSVSE